MEYIYVNMLFVFSSIKIVPALTMVNIFFTMEIFHSLLLQLLQKYCIIITKTTSIDDVLTLKKKKE